jgi:hypothetical protein
LWHLETFQILSRQGGKSTWNLWNWWAPAGGFQEFGRGATHLFRSNRESS